MNEIFRLLIREVLLEDAAAREEIASIAKKMAQDRLTSSQRRSLGRVLKDKWRKEADIASFDKVTFVHWQDIGFMSTLVSSPRGRDEIPTIPYRTTPWTQLRGIRKVSDKSIGAIIKGHPTLIANADMNSNVFKDGKIPFYEIPEEKQDQRRKSSGWNKYPGPQSPGSEADNPTPARSWEDYLVYSADEIVPHEKISFDVAGVFKGTEPLGWPEALIDNWHVEGLVVPPSVIEHYGIDELLDAFVRQQFPSDLPIYDVMGEIRKYTK